MDWRGLEALETISRARLLGRVDHFSASEVPGVQGADGESGTDAGSADSSFEGEATALGAAGTMVFGGRSGCFAEVRGWLTPVGAFVDRAGLSPSKRNESVSEIEDMES